MLIKTHIMKIYLIHNHTKMPEVISKEIDYDRVKKILDTKKEIMVRIYHKHHNQKAYQDMTIEEWLEWIKTNSWFYITYLS